MAGQRRLALKGGKSLRPPRARRGFNVKTKVKGALRRLFFISPHRADALKAAHIKGLNMYLCAGCKKPFDRKSVSVDHISPVVPVDWHEREFWDWDTVIENMFCGHEGLQVLCSDGCHHKKTSEERVQRGFEDKDSDGSGGK